MASSAQVTTMATRGIYAYPVTVTVIFTNDNAFRINQCDPLREKEVAVTVRAALESCSVRFGGAVVEVSLGDATPVGHVEGLELPIAAAILSAMGEIPVLENIILVGGLGMDGRVIGVRGAYIMGFYSREGHTLVVANADEESAITGQLAVPSRLTAQVRAVSNLQELITHTHQGSLRMVTQHDEYDFADIAVSTKVKRAMQVAATYGGYNILFVGPPGGGKTLLARRLNSIVPKLTPDELHVVRAIKSAAGTCGIARGTRPFRAPHHTISPAGFFGSGRTPGEVALAHQGTLFLEDTTEFNPEVLAGLHSVQRRRSVTLDDELVFPASFILVGSVLPCPCGYNGVKVGPTCTCTEARIDAHKRKIAKIIKHFDLLVRLSDSQAPMLDTRSSSEMREQVVRATNKYKLFAQTRTGMPFSVDVAGCPVLRDVATAIACLDGKDTVDQEAVDEATRLVYPWG